MIQDGITFNSVKTAGVEYDQWPIILTGQQGPDEDVGVINVVDIDWNGADLQSAVNAITDIPEGLPSSLTDGKVKSTGDLLQERIQQNSPMFARVA